MKNRWIVSCEYYNKDSNFILYEKIKKYMYKQVACCIIKKVNFPSSSKKKSILKSPFVHKKAWHHFGYKVYKQLIIFELPSLSKWHYLKKIKFCIYLLLFNMYNLNTKLCIEEHMLVKQNKKLWAFLIKKSLRSFLIKKVSNKNVTSV